VSFFVGTDVGGTFTDLWVSNPKGESRVFKVPTSKNVLDGVIDAVKLAAAHYQLDLTEFCSAIVRFGHGTTVGLNALLTNTASPTVILTTAGFGDTLEIGRLRRQTSGMNEIEMTDPFLRNQHAPLVSRRRIFEIEERIDSNGKVVVPLNEKGTRDIIRSIPASEAEAVAICTLFSVLNPSHELKLREIVRAELPEAFVCMSHEISPNVGEYARMSTTAANAALGPLAGRYLARLEATLREAGMTVPILMMTCAGGVLPTSVLNERPVYALFSGPAAGVVGSQAIGAMIGVDNILTTDIGGTSFDVGVIAKGEAIVRSEISVAGADMKVRSIDVESIGAGGGSIASVVGGELKVGPKSAGSTPGPVCYSRGGVEPTATDADLVLGVLDPENFLGGRMKLDKAAAEHAIYQRIAQPLGISTIEAAWGIRQILDSRMSDLLRRMTVERGYNPLDFVLFANGGAGPSHAWVLSAEIGLKGFIVPAAATAQSAFGTANSDLAFTAERPIYIRVQPESQPAPESISLANAAFHSAREEVQRLLLSAAPGAKIAVRNRASVRFRGQTNHLEVLVEGEQFDLDAYRRLVADFSVQYERLFGRGAGFSKAGYEVTQVQTTGTVHLPPPDMLGAGDQLTKVGSRPVFFDDPKTPIPTSIYRTVFPPPGATVEGPCIIEFPGQSVVVPPSARATADRYGNLHVERAS
jgi:N-methylhydantoinase A